MLVPTPEVLSHSRLRQLAAVGCGGLLLLGFAYWLTVEPAPSIRVRWRDDLSASRQAELERKYMLANGRAPMEDAPRSLAYDIQDTSYRNIRAVVTDPDVADTNDIDREQYRIRPNTQPGERWMWLAYRIPGLRDQRVRWTVLTLLSVMAVIGVGGLAVRHRRRAALRPAEDPFTSDVFDRLPSLVPALAPPSPDHPFYRARRCGAALLVAAAIGLPILDTWQAYLLGVMLLAAILSVGRPEWRRLVAAAAIVLTVAGIKAALPRADIAEGHNAFLVLNEGEPLQQALPQEIFSNWKAQFDALYQPAPNPYASWRVLPAVPTSAFARSADALWRRAKYSRQVDEIRFGTLGEFRGGFANDMHYNFWAGEMSRSTMPFFVMYELTPASVGSRLAWEGQLFWERGGGGFEEIVHPTMASRTIEATDAGKRVYVSFFPARDERRRLALQPSATLLMSQWARAALTLAATVAVFLLVLRPRWPDYLRAVAFFTVALMLIDRVMAISGATFLGRNYPPHGGGDDGLVHDGWGHAMALLAGDGHLVRALEGGEAVYWFTPGMRYLRMLEKLIFGDTNHLYALLLACVPLVVFYLMRHLLGTRRSWLVTACFCLVPVGNLSFLQYVTNARLGYAEAAGMGMFLLGLMLLLRTQPAWGGVQRNFALTAAAGAALALSFFLRPNFALAVVWLGAASAWASFKRKDPLAVVPLALGLSLALWMPFHNWLYGGEFFLVSRAGATISVPLGPRDYVTAAGDLLRGRQDSPAVAVTLSQLKGWLSGPAFVDLYSGTLMPLAWAAHVVRVFALLVACWVAVRWAAGRAVQGHAVGILAVAALLAHLPMLFIHATFDRYAILGWDLSLVVLIAWLARPAAVTSSVSPALA